MTQLILYAITARKQNTWNPKKYVVNGGNMLFQN